MLWMLSAMLLVLWLAGMVGARRAVDSRRLCVLAILAR